MKRKIRDNVTGEIIEVDDKDLGKYGLSIPTPSAQAQPEQASMQPVEVQQTTNKSFSQSVGEGLFGLLKGMVASTVNPVIDFANKASSEQAKAVKKTKKGDLFSAIANAAEATKNTFISPEAGRAALEAASFAVPIGKAAKGAKPVAKVLQKYVAPGAAIGGLQGASQENATPESILGSGLIGAGATTGIGALSKLLGLGSKAGSKAEEMSDAIRQETRQIKQPASVGGFQKEMAISKTLDKYKVKGTAEQQYSQLSSVMNNIEGKIKGVIEKNPNTFANINDIKNNFINNLQSSVRTGDLTKKQAINEVNGYLNDLLKAANIKITGKGLPGNIGNLNLAQLRQLKKLINQDYKSVQNTLNRDGALSSRQKVIKEAWGSLDSAVKDASPEMKELLQDESNIFRSAQSLSSSRFNPPTFRVAGTSLPKGVEQKGRDILASLLQGTGNFLQKTPQISGGGLYPLLATKGAVGLGSPSSAQLQSQQSTQQPTQEPILPSEEPTMEEDPASNKVRVVKQALAIAMMQDLSSGGKNVTELKAISDALGSLEDNQKIPVTAQTQMNLAKAGMRGLKSAVGFYEKDPSVVTKQVVPGQWVSRDFDSAMYRAVEALLRSRSGAAVPETEVRRYLTKFGPTIGDNPETIKFKFQQLYMDFNDVLSGAQNISGSAIVQ